MIDFLATVDTGVIGYRRSETEIPEKARPLHRELSAVIKKVLNSPVELELNEDDTQIMIELAHRGQGGRQVCLELQRESAGTRRLLVLLGLPFRALDEGGSLLVDELDASLHTHACEAVLQLFCSPKTNPNGAQLVATTHNTSLMKLPALRRDQIWFTQKDKDGATQLYPLADIRTRRGDNFESGCLQGRCGAVPFDEIRIRGRAAPNLKRRRHHREPKRRFIVFCEGRKTEPAYFDAIRCACSSTLIAVHAHLGVGVGVPYTIAVQAVEHAKRCKRDGRSRRRRDSFEERDQV